MSERRTSDRASARRATQWT